MPDDVRIRVLVTMRASPDGMTVCRYAKGEIYGPSTNPPMPPALAATFLREAWGEAIRDEANRKRSEAAKAQPREKSGEFEKTGAPTGSGQTRDPDRGSAAAKASASGTNRGAAEDASRVQVHAPAPAREAPAGPDPDSTCLWCAAAYARRATGGSAQRFCSAGCRQAFHTEARCYVAREMAAGRLTVASLREGRDQRARSS